MLDPREGGNSREDYERVSTQIVIHPRVADAQYLRIWVGLLDGRQRDLRWYVDGRLVQPQPVRPLAPAYEPGGSRRTPVLTGLYEIAVPESAEPYRVQVKHQNGGSV